MRITEKNFREFIMSVDEYFGFNDLSSETPSADSSKSTSVEGQQLPQTAPDQACTPPGR